MKHRMLLAAVAALMSSAAHADLQIFTDRTAWEAALSGPLTVEDFNALTPQELTPGDTLSTGLLDIFFDDNGTGNGEASILDGSSFGNIDGTNFFEGFTVGSDAILKFTFSTDVSAYGAEYFSPASGAGLTLIVGDEVISFLDLGFEGFDIGFVGIISDVPFSSISYSDEQLTFGEIFSVDNVGYVAIPTPGVFAGLGLLLWGKTGRRRRR
jgi:hypothetical protein